MASWPQVAEQNHGTRWNEFEEKTPSDPNKIWGPRAACTLLGNLGFLKTLPSVVKLTDFMCRWDQWWLILVAVLLFRNGQISLIFIQPSFILTDLNSAGLNFSSFWQGAAHGLHYLHLEEIR